MNDKNRQNYGISSEKSCLLRSELREFIERLHKKTLPRI